MAEQPLRTHQREALSALNHAWASDSQPRAWVVLPPGAGKTRVGIEAVAEQTRHAPESRAVVLVPNTAIQAQWVTEAKEHGLDAGTDKNLIHHVTCLTYQSLAVFDSEAADDAVSVTERLHPNGAALMDRIEALEAPVLVLDECHHLLEVWGQLLVELLGNVPAAHVLALTATPPESLTETQQRLVSHLFGPILYRVSVPAVVKEGHLAPFDEYVWLTTPTGNEEHWLAEQSSRFVELTHLLTTPGFGTTGFYEWLTMRFVAPIPATVSWEALSTEHPDLCDSALRMHHVDLLALPIGARLREEHRHAPDAEDWVRLLGDWLLHSVAKSEEPADVYALSVVKAALPSIGYTWTKRGVRRGTSPVDRVLARSAAKSEGAARIIAAEHGNLGVRTRVLVLCDYESASATVPLTLAGVQTPTAGSAIAALDTLLAEPDTTILRPMLVTGTTVAASPETLHRLIDHVRATDPELATGLAVDADGPGPATCSTGWTSRTWVRHITTFFEAGHSQVLVGTRGLLGEGWNARRISTLIDLTTATTLTAVVQTRGRALRTDPTWAEKVAANWTVVCVSEAHPTGAADWHRLVRKHEGFHGIDADGDIVDGVAHIDAGFSPYAPPARTEFENLNNTMLHTAADRDALRAAWKVGQPYQDIVWAAVRVRIPRPGVIAGDLNGSPTLGQALQVPAPRTYTANPRGATLTEAAPKGDWRATIGATAAATATSVAVAAAAGPWALAVAPLVAGGALIAHRRELSARRAELTAWVNAHLKSTHTVPALEQVAAAVAAALHRTGLTSVGVSALRTEVHPDGEYRISLTGTEEDSVTFSTAFDEAIGPVTTSKYLISRYTDARLTDEATRITSCDAAEEALRSSIASSEAWHSVPTALGRRSRDANHYLHAWRTWVAQGQLLRSSTPEGVGILAAVNGNDPFQATTVVRRHWG